jgi:hypothetical protein
MFGQHFINTQAALGQAWADANTCKPMGSHAAASCENTGPTLWYAVKSDSLRDGLAKSHRILEYLCLRILEYLGLINDSPNSPKKRCKTFVYAM